MVVIGRPDGETETDAPGRTSLAGHSAGAEHFEVIRRINAESALMLVVEQNANVALRTSEHAYVMETGRIVLDGASEQLAQNADIKEFYLGLTAVGERKSYRDVKHYKRRKRWLG